MLYNFKRSVYTCYANKNKTARARDVDACTRGYVRMMCGLLVYYFKLGISPSFVVELSWI